MAEYTKEDKLAFKKKDLLYARQTAANVTSAVFEGKEIDSETFLKYSEKIFKWLFQEQDKLKWDGAVSTKKQEVGVLPTPTLAQQKILDAIADKIGGAVDDDLKDDVLTWASKTHGICKYPENQNSVTEIVKYLEK